MKALKICTYLASLLFLCMTAGTPAQTIQISPDDTLYFGHIPEGKSAERKVSVFNLSNPKLNISDFRIEGTDAACFTLLNDPGTVSLGLLVKFILEVQFIPAGEGFFTARLIIESNAASSPDDVVLAGYGTSLKSGFIAFERIFGGTQNDGSGSVRVTSDGGFIIGGSTRQEDRYYNDAELIKLDRYGQMEWRQVYGIEDWSESFGETIPTADGGYIAVGSKEHSEMHLPPDIWIVKTDATGEAVWEFEFGDNENDGAGHVLQTADGGYLVSGSYQHDSAQRQDSDALLIKLNADGSLAWEKKYGGTGGGEGAGTLLQTADGGFLFCGSTSSYGAGEWDVYLVKVSAVGNEEWYKTYGGTDWDNGGRIIRTADGGYLLGGWTANFGVQARDFYIIKTDSAGNEQWHKTYGDVHKDHLGDFIETDDGGYLIAGSMENTFFTNEWRTDAWIFKIDGSGNEVWSRTFGGIQDEGFNCIRETDDEGYVVSGGANSYKNNSEHYLLKISGDGQITDVLKEREPLPDSYILFQNYPNPFNAHTVIRYSIPEDTHVTIDLCTIQGRHVRTLVSEDQSAGPHAVTWSAHDLPSGIYFYKLEAGGLSQTKRLLLLK